MAGYLGCFEELNSLKYNFPSDVKDLGKLTGISEESIVNIAPESVSKFFVSPEYLHTGKVEHLLLVQGMFHMGDLFSSDKVLQNYIFKVDELRFSLPGISKYIQIGSEELTGCMSGEDISLQNKYKLAV